MFRALKYRNYRLLWLGQTGHSLTLWMDSVARAVLILNLTDDNPVALSAVIAIRLAPILVFGLLAGALADRYDKKMILISTQWVSTGCHVFIGLMCLTGAVEVWHVFLTAGVAGSAMAFNQPVRQSLIPMTVPKEVVNAHPHLLLVLESYTQACEGATRGDLERFTTYYQRALDEDRTFRAVLKSLGWVLPEA